MASQNIMNGLDIDYVLLITGSVLELAIQETTSMYLPMTHCSKSSISSKQPNKVFPTSSNFSKIFQIIVKIVKARFCQFLVEFLNKVFQKLIKPKEVLS